jgi:hypothetical protein
MQDIQPIILDIMGQSYDIVSMAAWFLIVVATSMALQLLFKAWDRRHGVATRIISSGVSTSLLTAAGILSLLATWG